MIKLRKIKKRDSEKWTRQGTIDLDSEFDPCDIFH